MKTLSPINIFKTKRINHIVFLWLLLISFSSCALLTVLTIQIQYRNFKNEAKFYREQYLDEQKSVLKTKVEEVVEYVEYNSRKSQERLKDEIKNRVYEAWSVASHLYEKNKENISKTEIENLIKETLRPIRFNSGRGYYFIVSLDGVEELYPTQPAIEGTNLLNLQDITGKYVIQDEISTVENLGEGFVEGYWPNPVIPNDKGSLQYSFVKLFKPLNWLIGTGEFLSNVEQELQQESLEWLAKIRFSQGSYIFADTYTGDALLMDGKLIEEETNIWDLTDPDGVKVIQEETRIARSNPEGGFLRYLWRKENGREPLSVISYVKAFPEWQWVLGSAIYLEDLEQRILEQHNRLQQNVHRDIAFIILGFFLSIPIITLLSLFVSKGFKQEIDVFLSFFQSTPKTTERIPLSDLKLLEFKELGKTINHVIAKRREVELKLEELSRTDPLTSLPNRRDAQEKLYFEMEKATRQGYGFSLVLADIDFFKNVNDNYGHDAGDKVLTGIADLLQRSIRVTDSVARWGGEEFLFLLPDTDIEQAAVLCKKLRKKVENTVITCGKLTIGVTMTFGVAEWREGLDLRQLLALADKALYEGKNRGRNQVMCASGITSS